MSNFTRIICILAAISLFAGILKAGTLTISAGPSPICQGENITVTVTINGIESPQNVWFGDSSTSITFTNMANGESRTNPFPASSTGTLTLTASSSGCDSVSAEVTVVAIAGMQVLLVDNTWTDITGTLYVKQGNSISLRARVSPSTNSFPTGRPSWGDSASGTGPTATASFGGASTNCTDFYKVSVYNCGSGITNNVIVYTLETWMVPTDMFVTDRDTNEFGCGESLELWSFFIPCGGQASLSWDLASGSGYLEDAGDGSGFALYSTAEDPETATIDLYLVYTYAAQTPSGGSGMTGRRSRPKAAPTGATKVGTESPGTKSLGAINFVKIKGSTGAEDTGATTAIWHIENQPTIGYKAVVKVPLGAATPDKDVSWNRYKVAEDDCPATGTGCFASSGTWEAVTGKVVADQFKHNAARVTPSDPTSALNFQPLTPVTTATPIYWRVGYDDLQWQLASSGRVGADPPYPGNVHYYALNLPDNWWTGKSGTINLSIPMRYKVQTKNFIGGWTWGSQKTWSAGPVTQSGGISSGTLSASKHDSGPYTKDWSSPTSGLE